MNKTMRISYIALCLALVSAATVQSEEIKHKFVATDESGKQLLYVDESNPDNDWTVPLPGNRDIQLTTEGTVLVSVPTGYREYSLKQGKMIKEIKTDIRVKSVVRLKNGETLLAGDNGVVVLDKEDKKTAFHAHTLGRFFRLLRLSEKGNFLYTSGPTTITEMTKDGDKLRTLDLAKLTPESKKPYFMEQLPDGGFLIATGYGATVLIVDKDWKLIKAYGGKGATGDIKPYFFADAQRLASGNVVVAHWSGHGRKDSEKAPQAIEFDKDGKIVWSWHNPKRAGCLHGIEIIE